MATFRWSRLSLTKLPARARFRPPATRGDPNHPHRKSTGVLGLRKGPAGEELAIPNFPAMMSKFIAPLARLRQLTPAPDTL